MPALVLKRPRLVRARRTLPDDLRAVLEAIRQGFPLPPFRGVPPEKYIPWVERLGRAGRGRAVLKSFRLRPNDLRRLRELKTRTGASSETEVLRDALVAYEREIRATHPEPPEAELQNAEPTTRLESRDT